MELHKVWVSYSRLKSRIGNFYPLAISLAGIIVVVGASTLGYMYIEGWNVLDSYYMTVITMATVGFGEVQQLSNAGRIFTSVVIFAGVGMFSVMVGSMAQLLVEGRIQELLGRRRMKSMVSRLENHIIVCGYGRIGAVVAREIARENLPVVVIENNPQAIETAEHEGMFYVVGDATSDEILLSAGLMNARSLISTLTTEAANVYVVLTARQLNPKLTIISRAETEAHIPRLKMAGADRVVLPNMIGGLRMAQSVIRPTAITFLDTAMRGEFDLQMEELVVREDSELVGKDLVQSRIRPRFNLIIVAIKKHDGAMIFNPQPATIIEAQDTLLTIGKKENLSQLLEII